MANSSSAPVFLNESETRRLIDLDILFQRLEIALSDFSAENSELIVQPVRTVLNLPKNATRAEGSVFLTMPAFSANEKTISCKLLSLFPGNHHCPVINSVITLFDANDGTLKAIMAGNAITEIRTAVASALATKHLTSLSRIGKLAILGAGVQARGHIVVFKHFFDPAHISIWSRTIENAEKLADEFTGSSACASVQEAVKDADVIITATNSRIPILKHAWLKPIVHINSVGACLPDWREMDDALMTSSLVYTDSRAAAKQEAGDIIQSGAEIQAEVGQVINGTKTVPKGTTTTIFKSLGMAIEDTVAAQCAYEAYELERLHIINQ